MEYSLFPQCGVGFQNKNILSFKDSRPYSKITDVKSEELLLPYVV